jgi:hypothetical protein
LKISGTEADYLSDLSDPLTFYKVRIFDWNTEKTDGNSFLIDENYTAGLTSPGLINISGSTATSAQADDGV